MANYHGLPVRAPSPSPFIHPILILPRLATPLIEPTHNSSRIPAIGNDGYSAATGRNRRHQQGTSPRLINRHYQIIVSASTNVQSIRQSSFNPAFHRAIIGTIAQHHRIACNNKSITESSIITSAIGVHHFIGHIRDRAARRARRRQSFCIIIIIIIVHSLHRFAIIIITNRVHIAGRHRRFIGRLMRSRRHRSAPSTVVSHHLSPQIPRSTPPPPRQSPVEHHRPVIHHRRIVIVIHRHRRRRCNADAHHPPT